MRKTLIIAALSVMTPSSAMAYSPCTASSNTTSSATLSGSSVWYGIAHPSGSTSLPVTSVTTTDVDCSAAHGEIAGEQANQDATLSDHEGRITTAEGKISAQGARVDTLEGRADGADAKLQDHEGRIVATENKNSDQDATLQNHEERITDNTNRLDKNDARFESFNNTGHTVEYWASGVDSHLAQNDSRLNALEGWRGLASAQISSLQGDVKKLYAGVAIAGTMTVPHVDPGKKMALNFSIGEYEGTGAVTGVFALRANDNLQIFGGAGASFDGGALVKGGATYQW